MRKEVFCLVLSAMLFALSLPAEAQQPKKVPRIGILSPGSAGPSPQDGQADRIDDSAECVGESGPGDSVKQFWIADFGFWIEARRCTEKDVEGEVMTSQLLIPLSGFWFENLKSKIQKPPRRRNWLRLFAIVLTLTFGGVVAHAQQPRKVPLIGYLSARDQANDSPRSEGVLLGLRELGYVDGQNIAIEFRYAQGRTERFAELAAELVRLKVDLIVAAGGDLLIRPIMNTTKSIPIIMTGGGIDPVKAGFVKSLARPGGNITGLTNLVLQLGGKRLELFKEAVPKLARVAVLHDPASPITGDELKDVLLISARTLRLTIQPWELRRTDDFEKVFTAINNDRPDGLYVSTGALLNSNQTRIVGFALKSRLPSVYGRREYVDAGGLMYYGADLADSYRRVAYYVDRILKGGKPADLPVEQPKKFELVINLKAAKQIGLTIPPNVLARADRVIR